jgi:GTP-binding protein HflX
MRDPRPYEEPATAAPTDAVEPGPMLDQDQDLASPEQASLEQAPPVGDGSALAISDLDDDGAPLRARRARRDDDGHRGGFGEYGGETAGLIERTFRERIVLVGVTRPPATDEDTERHLDELALLVDTAGADAVATVVQRRSRPDPATYLGAGKVQELRELSDAVDADTVVFDDELSPAQQRNLEKALGRTALDRTAVILDIFAQNAHSQEGKAQVELAQIRYRLPRLRGKGTQMSQQRGGIGARQGGGETQLEVDRRRLVRRMHKLEADLRDVARVRSTQAKARQRSRLSTLAIVGYTNAGKSTLLNRLTDAGVLVEDRLFATLDATTRRLQLPGGEAVLVTDTVGFITKLPHQLVEAFKSTLEVVVDADLLVHVVDGSAPDPQEQIEAVDAVLGEIGAGEVPQLVVANKADLDPQGAARLVASQQGAVAVSAVTGEGIDGLLLAVADRLRSMSTVLELHVPFDRGDVLAAVHREGEVLVESATDQGMRVRARLDEAAASRLAPYVVS